MASSSKPEDREKAVTIKKALEKASTEGVDTKFDKLVATLKSTKAVTISDLSTVMERNKELASDLRAILNILLTDNRDEELRRERERIQELLKKLNEAFARPADRPRLTGARHDGEGTCSAASRRTSPTPRATWPGRWARPAADGDKEPRRGQGRGRKPRRQGRRQERHRESKADSKNANAGRQRDRQAD
jgi:hypothetical protein